MTSTLRYTLLPEPVAPATSTCGIFVRSETNGLPTASTPSSDLERALLGLVGLGGEHLLADTPYGGFGSGSRCRPRPCPGSAPGCGSAGRAWRAPGRPRGA